VREILLVANEINIIININSNINNNIIIILIMCINNVMCNE